MSPPVKVLASNNLIGESSFATACDRRTELARGCHRKIRNAYAYIVKSNLDLGVWIGRLVKSGNPNVACPTLQSRELGFA